MFGKYVSCPLTIFIIKENDEKEILNYKDILTKCGDPILLTVPKTEYINQGVSITSYSEKNEISFYPIKCE